MLRSPSSTCVASNAMLLLQQLLLLLLPWTLKTQAGLSHGLAWFGARLPGAAIAPRDIMWSE